MNTIKFAGFTLVELLVVIAIVGILAAFGINSYSSAHARAQASRDRLSLLQLPLLLEQHFSVNARYPENLDSILAPAPDGGFMTPRQWYSIAYNRPSAAEFTLIAQLDPGKALAENVPCYRLEISSTGELSGYDNEGNDITGQCWRQ